LEAGDKENPPIAELKPLVFKEALASVPRIRVAWPGAGPLFRVFCKHDVAVALSVEGVGDS